MHGSEVLVYIMLREENRAADDREVDAISPEDMPPINTTSRTCFPGDTIKVKRKNIYSAVGSHVMAEEDENNMGIMSKLKKLQKERLIVARLGFPDQAMEIDRDIEKIRADLRVSPL